MEKAQSIDILFTSDLPELGGQGNKQRRPSVLQGGDIASFVIRGSIFPAAKHDAKPLVGEGSNRCVMIAALSSELVIKGFGPEGMVN